MKAVAIMSYYDFEHPDFFKPQARRHTYQWHQVWTAVLTHPSTDTFYSILDDEHAGAGRAFAWVIVAGIISTSLTFLFGDFGLSGIEALFGGVVLGSFVGAFSLLVSGLMMQSAAKIIGGQGTYGKYLYASAAFSAPLMLVNALIVPFATTQSLTLSLLTLGIFGYQLVLTAMSLRAVNDFTWEQAIGTMVLNIILWVGMIVALIIFIGMLI